MTNIDLGPLPKVHPRHDVNVRAALELDEFIFAWTKKWDLSSAEQLHLLSGRQERILRDLVAIERRSRG